MSDNVKTASNIFKSGIVRNIVAYVVGFITRTIFIHNFGKDLLGINSTVSSIMEILSLAELGVGTSFTYILYGALNEKDEDHITAIVYYLRKVYRLIGVLIVCLGLLLLPFLNRIVVTSVEYNGYVIPCYIIYVINASASYFFSAYKRCILMADKKENIVNNIICVNSIIVGGIQIATVYLFGSYFVYMIVGVMQVITLNYLIAYKANSLYPYLKEGGEIPIPDRTKKKIKKSIISIFVIKLGQAFYKTSDNLVISKFLFASTVGVYSNYVLIHYMMHQFLSLVVTSFTAVIGNIAKVESKGAIYIRFKRLDIIVVLLYMVCAVGYFNCINPFVELWLGEEYLLNKDVVLVISTRFFLDGVNMTLMVCKDALGLFEYGRWMSLLTGVVNLVLSIWWLQFWGLFGVIFASLICDFFIYYIIYPKAVIKNGMNMGLREYYIRFSKTWLCYFFSIVFSDMLINGIYFASIAVRFVIGGIISVLIVLGLYSLFFAKNTEYRFFVLYLYDVIRKRRNVNT